MTSGANRTIALFGILASTTYPTTSIWGATIRDDVSDSSYQALAASAAYASVGMFVSNGPYTGSGVLIAPDWVLTTAHNLLLATTGTFTVGGTSYTADQLIMNPGWNNGSVFNGYDFGLAHLTSSVQAIPPATLYTGSSEMGQTGTYVGFGATGTGLTGYQTPPDNLERAFQNVIDGSFNNPSVLLGSDFDNPKHVFRKKIDGVDAEAAITVAIVRTPESEKPAAGSTQLFGRALPLRGLNLCVTAKYVRRKLPDRLSEKIKTHIRHPIKRAAARYHSASAGGI